MNTTTNTAGITFPFLLGLLFIGLKLTGYIDWSWWWVLAPFWAVPLACLLIVFVCCLVIVASKRTEKSL